MKNKPPGIHVCIANMRTASFAKMTKELKRQKYNISKVSLSYDLFPSLSAPQQGQILILN